MGTFFQAETEILNILLFRWSAPWVWADRVATARYIRSPKSQEFKKLYTCNTFMLTVLARLTLWTAQSKKSYFRGWEVLNTLEDNRTSQIKCIVSQLQPTRRSPQVSGGRLQLANDAFYLAASAVFQCMKHRWTTEVSRKTSNLSFFSVSWANMVNVPRPAFVLYVPLYARGLNVTPVLCKVEDGVSSHWCYGSVSNGVFRSYLPKGWISWASIYCLRCVKFYQYLRINSYCALCWVIWISWPLKISSTKRHK
jgi:hypothetical protein